MKRLFWLVALALATGPGCVTLPKTWLEARGKKPDVEAPRPPPIVLADEVTEINFAQKINALREELDYAETHPPARVIVHTVDGVK